MSMKMTMAEFVGLKPCPFCGGEADATLSQSRWGQSYTIHHDALGKCPAEYVGMMKFATEAEAIAAWNTRAEQIAHEAQQRLARVEHIVDGLGEVKGEIVRCRDCVYFKTDELGDYCTLLDFEDVKSMGDGFCAWGERR